MLPVIQSDRCQWSRVTAASDPEWLLLVIQSDCCQRSRMTPASDPEWPLPVIQSDRCQWSRVTAASDPEWPLPVIQSDRCQWSRVTAASDPEWPLPMIQSDRYQWSRVTPARRHAIYTSSLTKLFSSGHSFTKLLPSVVMLKGYRTSSIIYFCMDQQLHSFRRTCELEGSCLSIQKQIAEQVR